MSNSWYYVDRGNRVGPVSEEDLEALISQSKLGEEDYIWRKGFPDWKKIKDVDEVQHFLARSRPSSVQDHTRMSPMASTASDIPINWNAINHDEKLFYVLIGADRGTPPVTYGPYSLDMVIRLFQEKRINGKTYFWCKGMGSWTFLAETPLFQKYLGQGPLKIEDSDRRGSPRRPFVARMFFHNNEQLFEGLCRDISIGGVQVLISNFPGTVGDRISLNVHPENSDLHFVASGEIVRMLDGGQGFSFRFINLATEAAEMIKSYIYGEK